MIHEMFTDQLLAGASKTGDCMDARSVSFGVSRNAVVMQSSALHWPRGRTEILEAVKAVRSRNSLKMCSN